MAHIVVLGAGVVGLSTAIKILECGHEVTIVAEHFPGDKKTIEYTSPWAGADHMSDAGDNIRQRDMDRETFQIMWKMSETNDPAAKCFKRITEFAYFVGTKSRYAGLEVMPDFRELDAEELAPSSDSGYSFSTVTIDTAVYLPYLLSVFLTNGGSIVRSKVMHISQIAQGAYTPTKPGAIVICAGLGARFLGGVEDPDVYPIRGQTVLIRAPWVDFGCSQSRVDGDGTYVIPRRSGDVILGGTKGVDDWYPYARPETSDDIVKRVLVIAPGVAPPESRADGRVPTVDDVKGIVVEEGCGLRPGRRGGVRLEVGEDGNVPLVFNYGHGGSGYQSSWGSARIAVDLLKGVLGGVSK